MHLLAVVFSAVAAAASAATMTATVPAGIPESPPTTVDVTARPLPSPIAPADEYFGRLKLSNLGVRNIIHALAVEGNSPLALPLERARIMGVDTAIVQWGDRYPADPWLRRAAINFAGVIAQKHDVATDMIAIDQLLLVSMLYRNTPYAKLARDRANAIALTNTIDWGAPAFDPPSLYDLTPLRVDSRS